MKRKQLENTEEDEEFSKKARSVSHDGTLLVNLLNNANEQLRLLNESQWDSNLMDTASSANIRPLVQSLYKSICELKSSLEKKHPYLCQKYNTAHLHALLDEQKKNLIKQLPEYIIGMIYSFLCADNIIAGQFVCKTWYNALSKTQLLSSVAILQSGSESYPQNIFLCNWNETKFWMFYKRFIRNDAQLETIHIDMFSFSLFSILHMSSLIERRAALENTQTRRDVSSRIKNKVKKLSLPTAFTFFRSNYLLKAISTSFPQIETLELPNRFTLRVYDMVSLFPNLRKLTVGLLSFEIPEDSEGEDNEYDISDKSEYEVFTQFSKWAASIKSLQNLQALDLNISTTFSQLVNILYFFPNIAHLLISLDMDIGDDESDEEVTFFMKTLNSCDVSNLKLLEISFNIYSSILKSLPFIELLIETISKASNLEQLTFDIDHWNEKLNDVLLSSFIVPLLNKDRVRLRKLVMNEPTIFSNTFQNICQLARKHQNLSMLEVKIQHHQSFKFLQGCEGLTNLHLNSHQVNPSAAKYIEQLVNLEELYIDCNVKINFQKLMKLQRLYLCGRVASVEIESSSLLFIDMDEASISNIVISCPNLYKLLPANSANMVSLISCLKLEQFISDEMLTECHFENCPLLKWVDLCSSTSLSRITITNCPRIKVLGISIDRILNPLLPLFESISSSLRWLHLCSCEISDSFLVDFIASKLQILEEITFEKILFTSDMKLGESKIENLPVNINMRELFINDIPLGSDPVPFKMLSLLFPNIQLAFLKNIKEMSNESKKEMREMIYSWNNLESLTIIRLTCLSNVDIINLIASMKHKKMKKLNIKPKNSFIDLTLSEQVSATIEYIEVTGCVSSKNGLPNLKSLVLKRTMDIENEIENLIPVQNVESENAVETFINSDLIKSLPQLQILEIKLFMITEPIAYALLDKLSTFSKKLELVIFFWDSFSNDGLDIDIASLHEKICQKYPNINVVLSAEH
jgi:hypothetical protein